MIVESTHIVVLQNAGPFGDGGRFPLQLLGSFGMLRRDPSDVKIKPFGGKEVYLWNILGDGYAQ
jgi:hypothetical protein